MPCAPAIIPTSQQLLPVTLVAMLSPPLAVLLLLRDNFLAVVSSHAIHLQQLSYQILCAGQRASLSSSTCQDAEGAPVDCCVWQVDSWVGPYMTLSNVTLLWSIFLVFEVRVFTIAGTIAQWYFSPPGLAANQGTTMRSVRHALGASFGSLSLGSLVLTVVQLLRNAMEK